MGLTKPNFREKFLKVPNGQKGKVAGHGSHCATNTDGAFFRPGPPWAQRLSCLTPSPSKCLLWASGRKAGGVLQGSEARGLLLLPQGRQCKEVVAGRRQRQSRGRTGEEQTHQESGNTRQQPCAATGSQAALLTKTCCHFQAMYLTATVSGRDVMHNTVRRTNTTHTGKLLREQIPRVLITKRKSSFLLPFIREDGC